MGSLGGAELLLILVLALLLFGPRRLPQIGRTLGRTLGELRNASRDFRVSLEREVELERPDEGTPLGPTLPAIARGAQPRQTPTAPPAPASPPDAASASPDAASDRES